LRLPIDGPREEAGQMLLGGLVTGVKAWSNWAVTPELLSMKFFRLTPSEYPIMTAGIAVFCAPRVL
jgi:hypothetical protein